MAGQQQYYEEPADQQYYEQQPEAQAATGEDLSALATVPWLAIALAVHVILLVIFYFITPKGLERPELQVMLSQLEQEAMPPTPEQPPEEEVDIPRVDEVQEKPTEDERIVPDAQDDNNEDPSEKPFQDLAENPNDDPSDDESPHPNKDSTTSAVGLGGGIGGGGGKGGRGGFDFRRARGGGGSPRKHEDRMTAALEWLKDHQNREGYWSATTFSDDSTRVNALKTYNIEFMGIGDKNGDKGWERTCDVGLTGLALLAFVGAGYDHKTGEYRNQCRLAVQYLLRVQDNDGCFSPKEDDHFVYNHAICTMAVAEAYGLSGDNMLRSKVERAVQFILDAQNPGYGWRYGVKPNVNDSSVTGWMVLALKSCSIANLEFNHEQCYTDAANWFKMVTVDVAGYPKTGYDQPGSNNARLRSANDYDNNPSMDSIYVMSMLFMNKADLTDSTIKALSRVCIEKDFLPRWELRKIDYYFWYYASLALFQVGGSTWDTWEKPMSKTLLDSQRGYHQLDKDKNLTSKETLDEHGSWDSVDAWGTAGGRVYSTAINCLTLQVYYRYQQLNQTK